MKGFCHVTFEDEGAVDKALEKNGEDLDGRNVKVDKALPRQEGGRGDFRDRRVVVEEAEAASEGAELDLEEGEEIKFLFH